MNYYISPRGEYYEGVQAHPLDAEVPRRPHPRATWDGAQWSTPPASQLLDEDAQRSVDAEDRMQFELHFDLENRVRALEGKQPITRGVYRDALIARWKQLNS